MWNWEIRLVTYEEDSILIPVILTSETFRDGYKEDIPQDSSSSTFLCGAEAQKEDNLWRENNLLGTGVLQWPVVRPTCPSALFWGRTPWWRRTEFLGGPESTLDLRGWEACWAPLCRMKQEHWGPWRFWGHIRKGRLQTGVSGWKTFAHRKNFVTSTWVLLLPFTRLDP